MSNTDILTPRFEEVFVADNLKNGYWLQAVDINGDGRPDLVASRFKTVTKTFSNDSAITIPSGLS